MDIAALINRLRAVFPARQVREQIVRHDCGDCLTLESQLSEATWEELAATFIEEQSDILPLLSQEAYLAFIPAWLRQAVVKPDSEAAAMVLVNLRTTCTEWFSTDQAVVVLDCARFSTANNIYGPSDPVNVDTLAAIRRNLSLS